MSLIFTAFDISLALSVFTFGLQAQRLQDVRYMLARPRLLLLSLLAMFVVTPFLALLIVVYVDVPLAGAVAIVALSLSMIPPMLPQKEIGAGGHGSYAIGLVVVVSLLAPIGIPFLVDFLGRLTGRPYGIATGDVVLLVLKLVFAPLLAGVAFGAVWPDAAAAVRRYAPRVANGLVLVALVALLLAVLPATVDLLTSRQGLLLVAAGVAMNAGALVVGDAMGGPGRSRSIVLGLSCASRHPALALSIATSNYPSTSIAIMVVVLQMVNGVMCSLYLRRRRVGTALPGAPEGAPPAQSGA